MSILRLLIALAMVGVAGMPAAAQQAYVSASVFGDVVRSTHARVAEGGGGDAGEAIGFGLRVGTELGSAWGVELEFARPGEVTSDLASRPLPVFLEQQLALTTLLPGGAPIIPPIVYEVHSSVRHTTLAASLWFQQQLSASVGLAYLGGMSFGRTTSEFQVSYTGFPRGLPVVPPPSITSESIEYGVRPMVGFEVRIAMTDRARIVPGLRLHAESGLWLVRPSVALGWSF